jgi:putative ABC transport system ATP-binding protein
MNHLPTNSPIVEAKNVSKIVPTIDGDLTILQDISFSIKPGQSVAIIGRSGSGKTTLLGLLAGLDNVSNGHISLNGQILNELSESERTELRARQVGFIFQNFQLLPTLSALENVMLPLELAEQDNAQSKAKELLERVGLEKRLKHLPKQLSGGEQQRVAIARAFVSQPTILFADEPTGNLDHETGLLIENLLFELNQQHKTTLVLVTHDRRLAAHCERHIHMQNGTITEE